MNYIGTRLNFNHILKHKLIIIQGKSVTGNNGKIAGKMVGKNHHFYLKYNNIGLLKV